jgi:hypothetical protein
MIFSNETLNRSGQFTPCDRGRDYHLLHPTNPPWPYSTAHHSCHLDFLAAPYSAPYAVQPPRLLHPLFCRLLSAVSTPGVRPWGERLLTVYHRLYAGKATGPEPDHILCVVQSGLINGYGPP